MGCGEELQVVEGRGVIAGVLQPGKDGGLLEGVALNGVVVLCSGRGAGGSVEAIPRCSFNGNARVIGAR